MGYILKKEEIISDYKRLKQKAKERLLENDFDCCAKFIETAARIGYKFNFQYCDDELEEVMESMASKILGRDIYYESVPNRIIFFDSFCLDNRGLTQQYIRAIKSWGSELLFISSSKKIGKDIMQELIETPNTTIYLINEKGFEKNIVDLSTKIEKFCPSKILMHFSPWDILGITLFSKIKESDRYLINLTDHAFWLGKISFDYSLEFRNYGAYISEKHRGICRDKLLLMPYYPIESSNKFQGFPSHVQNKVIAFSGSTYNKLFSEGNVFLNLIKELLDRHPNLIFLLAGSGNQKPLLKFLKDNNIEDRFLLLGDRNDIGEVFQRIDIYINTYPIIGGLMSQYAAFYNKPIIGYTDPDLYSLNDTEGLLGLTAERLLVKTNQSDFIQYFDKLINDKVEIDKNIAFTKEAILTPEVFNVQLKNVLENKEDAVFNTEVVQIDLEKVFEMYLYSENNFLKEYFKIFGKLRFELFRFSKRLFLKILFRKLVWKLIRR